MHKITPFLWFDSQAEEAARFYVSLFADARVTAVTRYGDGAPMPAGSALTVAFEVEGQPFVALNGGPVYKFTPAVSFVIDCKSQPEVDRLWDALCADGGLPSRCGWLTDRFGLSWQIVPDVLVPLLNDPDPARGQRVMAAMMQMAKLDIAALQAAAAG
jgi:predicted 3-demethylubiquinone-9 3-methyltransferase (glyoxalase superfamily)